MGILDNVERGIERTVRGIFSAGSARKVKPVEIANALRIKMDRESVAITEGRTLAPNVFTISFAPENFEQIRHWGSALAEELCDEAIRYAHDQGYSLQGPVRVTFTEDDDVDHGDIDIEAAMEQGQSTPHHQPDDPMHATAVAPKPAVRLKPVVEVEGKKYALNSSAVSLGRSAEADITISDPSISRKHLEIRVHGDSVSAVDLGSTNGFSVNGRKAHQEVALRHGDSLTLGHTTVIFRMLPDRSRQAPHSPSRGSGR